MPVPPRGVFIETVVNIGAVKFGAEFRSHVGYRRRCPGVSTDRRVSGTKDARFFPADCVSSGPQPVLVIDGNLRDNGEVGIEDIDGVLNR